MKANHILVDFENVPHLPLDRIGEDCGAFSRQPTSFVAIAETGKATYAEKPGSVIVEAYPLPLPSRSSTILSL